MTRELAILGAGNMAEAIARGLLAGNVFSPRQIVAADVSQERREFFTRELNIECLADPVAAAALAPTLLVCVKPQQMADLLRAISPSLRESALVISIAAGISTVLMERFLSSKQTRIVRAMPNMPMLVGQGMLVLSAGPRATGDDLARARQLFEPAATVIEMSEDKLDAVTALSGSGPAYFFVLVEQMIRAGVELGLEPGDARTLAVRTAVGVGKLLDVSPESPETLRRRVTSPGGTTEAALAHMQQNHLDDVVVESIKAAARRARELGK